MVLGIFAFTISMARVAIFRAGPAFKGQGYMYTELARALASGQGFTETHGAWRGHATIMRAPLWPFVLSLPMRGFPRYSPASIAELTTAFTHAITAFAVAVLVGILSGGIRRRMLLAVLMTALLPEVQPFLGGYCEPLAAAILVTGTILLCRGQRFFWGGVLTLSLLPLVRPNFAPLWIVVTALIWWLQFHNRSPFVFANKRRLIAAALLFYIPSAAWVVRNYWVSGAFPVLAGTASMTFYGNYNPLSATPGLGFGSWVGPDSIPGEEKTVSLSRRMSEVETLRYWDLKGKEFIAQHWKVVPLLMVAHVVHPVLPSLADRSHKYSFWLLRLLLYAATFMAVRQGAVRLDSWFAVLLTCSVLVSAVTIVLYSGDGRYLDRKSVV